jgi:hypothetical protein
MIILNLINLFAKICRGFSIIDKKRIKNQASIISLYKILTHQILTNIRVMPVAEKPRLLSAKAVFWGFLLDLSTRGKIVNWMGAKLIISEAKVL